MKITICGSLRFIEQMNQIKNELEMFDHQVLLPESAKEAKDNIYWKNLKELEPEQFSKIKGERIKLHFKKIDSSEGILVLNYNKDNNKNYIGANTFLEMGYAFSQNKKIFTINPLPKENHHDELISMGPIIINNDLTKITQ